MQSAFFSRLRSAVGRGIQQSYLLQEYGGQDTAEILIKKGKLFFGNPWWFHSASLSSPAELEALLWISSVFAARSETHLINKKRNLSLVGAISRTFSTPSVSSPTYQVCGYHIDQLFHDPIHSKFLNISMAAPCFKAVFGGQILDKFTARHCEISTSSGNGIVSCSNRKFGSSRKASISTRKQEPLDKFNVYGYFGYSIVRKWNSKPCLGSGLSSFHRSSSAFCSADAAQDVSFDNTSVEEVTTPSADSFETNSSTVKTLKLLSGSSYLPHPDKEETGGEDAHFICSDEQAIGVADGVGGWADLGIDAGKYARELMSNSVAAIQEEPKGFVDPARVLLKAHSSTKSKGSSTACIIALADQGLHAINLGDSGFMVVRDGCTIFRSPVQQHGFNFTYQLENGNNGDLPSSGQVFTVPIAPGDVIIAGTDGLFDNLYNNEVSAVVVHAMRAGLGPQVAAQKIAALARERAQDRNRQTPFSTSAQDAGFRYYGGKLDDITVVVSYITRSSEMIQWIQWMQVGILISGDPLILLRRWLSHQCSLC